MVQLPSDCPRKRSTHPLNCLINPHINIPFLSTHFSVKADLDQFLMNDVGYGTHGSKTHHNRSLIKNEDTSTNSDVSNKMMVATAIVDNPLFSSPQNRRASMGRYSQKSQKSSFQFLGQSMRSARDTTPIINSSTYMSIPRDTSDGAASVAAGDASSDSLGETGPPTRTSRRALLGVRKSADRIQEVLGELPILLVDDSVSILKMTKRAIQNECVNIRSIHLFTTPDFWHRLTHTLVHTLST